MEKKPDFEIAAKEFTKNESPLVYLRRGKEGEDSGPDWLDLTHTRNFHFIEGCEHVWKTYTHPVKCELSLAHELIKKLESELSSAQEKNRRLLEALKEIANSCGPHNSSTEEIFDIAFPLISKIENNKV